MDKEKEIIRGKVENAVQELHSYLHVAMTYADSFEDIQEVQRIDLILQKMQENIDIIYDIFKDDKLGEII